MHTHTKIDVIPLCTSFLRRSIYFLLAAGFFGLLAFLVVALLRAFLAGLAALLDEELAAGAVALVAEAADGVTAFVDFDLELAAAFFFGAAAFFLGLFALLALAAFGLAAALDFGFADLAFLAVVAFFLVALAAGVAATGAAGAAEALASVVTIALVLALATFFIVTFFVADAERFRLAAPPAALLLLDDRAFLVGEPPAFLVPTGVFDRLRGLADGDFFAAAFFLVPAADALFAAGTANLKLPLAPTPLVCFSDLFFVPARNADLRC